MSSAVVSTRSVSTIAIWFAVIAGTSLTTGLIVPQSGVDQAFASAALAKVREGDTATVKAMVSPSLAVFRYFFSTLALRSPEALGKFVSSSEHLAALPTGTTVIGHLDGASKELVHLMDDTPKSTWSSKTGKQKGGEKLRLTFPQPILLSAIDLSPGSQATDFPRGLELRGGVSCAEQPLPLLASYANWQGSLRLTPDGFPYFAGQDAVYVPIDPAVRVSCVELLQTGTAPYDWSIADIRIVSPSQ